MCHTLSGKIFRDNITWALHHLTVKCWKRGSLKVSISFVVEASLTSYVNQKSRLFIKTKVVAIDNNSGFVPGQNIPPFHVENARIGSNGTEELKVPKATLTI